MTANTWALVIVLVEVAIIWGAVALIASHAPKHPPHRIAVRRPRWKTETPRTEQGRRGTAATAHLNDTDPEGFPPC